MRILTLPEVTILIRSADISSRFARLAMCGIRLGRVVYHASQPWPFPYSLMIGCFGEALNEEIDPDLTELEDCRWFERGEVLAMLDKSHPSLFVPPPGAIAHHLIRAWAESA